MGVSVFSPSDIAGVFTIEQQSFKHPWSRASFVQELACREALHLVIRIGPPPQDAVAGYLCARWLVDEMYILKLAVDRQWRRCGLASRLLEESLDRAVGRNITAALLDVRLSNRPAIELYKKHEFVAVGIRPRYYADTGEDALVMKKLL